MSRVLLASLLPLLPALGCQAEPPPASPVVDLGAVAQGAPTPAKAAPQAPTSAADAPQRDSTDPDEEGDNAGAVPRPVEGNDNGGRAGALSALREFGVSGGVGLGTGTLGHGDGTRVGQGSEGPGGTRGDASKVRTGATQINGRLPPEIIQRIVRRNLSRIRFCYEKGLLKDPALQGRVAVRFVIGAQGNVTEVVNAGSDLKDQEAVSCMLAAFKSLSFPKPEGGGVVTVTYPLQFASAASAASAAPGAGAP